jgi:hypothetical protein
VGRPDRRANRAAEHGWRALENAVEAITAVLYSLESEPTSAYRERQKAYLALWRAEAALERLRGCQEAHGAAAPDA